MGAFLIQHSQHSTNAPPLALKLGTGFLALPNRRFDAARHTPHTLNILLVGPCSSGRATFINTLFNTAIIPPSTNTHDLCLQTHSSVVKEAGVVMSVNVFQVQGHGDARHLAQEIALVRTLLQSRFDAFMQAEGKANCALPTEMGSWIHTVIYILCADTGALSHADAVLLRTLEKYAPVFPVFAKADRFLPHELAVLKKRTREDWQRNELSEQQFAFDRVCNAWPFAVIAGTELGVDEASGLPIRARTYPWGTVNCTLAC